MKGKTNRDPSKSTDLWRTPKWLFNACSVAVGGFDLDLCATADDALVPVFCEDIFAESPNARAAWCNPPYSRKSEVIDRVLTLVGDNKIGECVMCLPASTDTSWFADLMSTGIVTPVFVKGRVPFGDPTKNGRTAPIGGTVLFAIDKNEELLKTTVRKLARELKQIGRLSCIGVMGV